MAPHLRRLLTWAPVLLATLLAPSLGAAAVLTVTSFGDSGAAGQLRALIAGAAAGDTIVVPPGTVVLSGAAGGSLPVTVDLTIVGAGAALTVIDGGGADRVFDVGAVTAVIAGLTIRNGDAGAAGAGGGLHLQGGGALTLAGVTVSDNVGIEGGGGIFNEGTLTVTGSTLRGNSTGGPTASGGGGVLNFGTMTLTHSTVSGNAATGSSSSALGGGLENVGVMVVTNSTISGNRAQGNGGGGIYQAVAATSLVLTNATVADNVADGDGNGTGFGGGLAAAGGGVTLENTILAGNRLGGAGSGRDCWGSPTSLGHNVIEDTGGCAFVPAVGDQVDVHARLEPLGDNGGPTPTHALRRNSPAVDAGSAAACPAADQRGVARPQDGDRDGVPACDVGAFELVRR